MLKGVRQLPVTTKVQYTFYKLNEYFQEHSKETDKLISKRKMYSKNIEEWMELQKTKSMTQMAMWFDNNEWIYQLDEPGWTMQDSVQFGGRTFTVMS